MLDSIETRNMRRREHILGYLKNLNYYPRKIKSYFSIFFSNFNILIEDVVSKIQLIAPYFQWWLYKYSC